MKVLIVILNYKGWSDTLKCLESLSHQTYKDHQIYLIENGSGDASAKKLKPIVRTNEKIIWQENDRNLGFTGGVNQGIRYALDNNLDAVALLNNDAVTDKDWLKNLVAAMQKTRASIVTGLLLSEDGKTIDDAGDLYTIWGVPELRAENQPTETAPESGFVFGASGGATLYKTDLFREIGLFDEKFFAYNEDIDIDWRAQLAGHKVYYEKSAIAYHKHSATSKKMPGFTTMQVFKNLPMVFWKNVPARLLWSIGWRFFLAYWMFFGYKILRGELVPAFKGVCKGFMLLPHALSERRKIQKNRKINAKYLKTIILPKLPPRSIRRLKRPLQ
ncbi:glycosyltransferase family 2 protein [Candidatus Saccharibacteria bacterium]|nr:glycosyltransferase family 2 protein [Candidatus Saccharibacteria bacterium]MCL1962908.1 glycosyltransferase family 2 protein [Candidatus Saccharibacteria bacterium]